MVKHKKVDVGFGFGRGGSSGIVDIRYLFIPIAVKDRVDGFVENLIVRSEGTVVLRVCLFGGEQEP